MAKSLPQSKSVATSAVATTTTTTAMAMATTSSTSYPKERDGFYRDLQHFHDTRGTPFRRPPAIAGKEIDLYLLYTLVTAQGGWIKVNSKNGWVEVLEQLKLPKECVNGSVALKQIYLRYLDRWEKVHFLGEEADRGSDDDEESRHKRWSARALHSVPLNYNYAQHAIPDVNREYNHLSTNLYKPSDYDRLALSLISPLPNEQDFAINVCTLLSNDGKHTLKLDRHPRLLDYLLGHAGVFCHGSLRRLFGHYYSDIRKHPIHRFWHEVLRFKEFLDLTNESKFVKKCIKVNKKAETTADSNSIIKTESQMTTSTASSLVSLTFLPTSLRNIMDEDKPDRAASHSEETCLVDSFDDSYSGDSDSDCEITTNCQKRFKRDPDDDQFFCMGRGLGTQDQVGQRVLQVATVLRNLSFVEENVSVMLRNKTFIRFVLLCLSSGWANLRNLGMDMLGNVALEFLVRDHPTDRLAEVLLKLVVDGLQSEDRTSCISSLEVLNKLSQNEANEDALVRHLEQEVYEKVCSFLTIHDVMLLIYTLECLYSLSSLGERSCNLIVNKHGVVDTLVSLVTVEGKSYGPRACIGMKLVETLPGGQSCTATSNSQAAHQSAANGGLTSASPTSTSVTTTTLATPAASSAAAVLTSASSSTVVLATPAKSMAHPTSTPARPVHIAPQRLLSISPAMPSATPVSVSSTSSASTSSGTTLQTMTPQQIIQQQHAHQQAIHENEQFALAWLRATYEPCANMKVDHQELYKHYLNSCSKIGRRGVISPLHFPRCVRSVFGGTVGPNPMKPANPSEPQYYEGIKVRAQPLIINVQPASNSLTPKPPNTTITTTTTTTTTPLKGHNNRRKPSSSSVTSPPPPLPSSVSLPPPAPLQQPAAAASQSPALNVTIQDHHHHHNNPVTSPSSQMETVIATNPLVPSPASPILKAQLSAPPKQRDTTTAAPTATCKGDVKSQVMAHPHLSQALLGSGSSNTSSTSNVTGSSKEQNQTGQSNTSLIKSLLATKVNDCMTTVSMRTATDCQNVAQVAARQQQQRLLAQQVTANAATPDSKCKTTGDSSTMTTPKSAASARVNGARQLFPEPAAAPTATADPTVADPAVSSTTTPQFTSSSVLVKSGKREPPQPPPPPLAPLSGNMHTNATTANNNPQRQQQPQQNIKPRFDNEDSNSTGNNSLASSVGLGTIGIGGISSTEDGDNSLTSFEGLLNGMPNLENPLGEDSNSKDSIRLEITKNKPLRLADLLEKKVEKNPPTLNGSLGKDMNRNLDLVENHIEKALSEHTNAVALDNADSEARGLKRPALDDASVDLPDAKRPMLSGIGATTATTTATMTTGTTTTTASSVNVNGTASSSAAPSPAPPDSVSSSSNGGEESGSATVSTAAAKLFADMAADILEDEDEEQLLEAAAQPAETVAAAVGMPQMTAAPVQQVIVDNSQQMLQTQLRQIIVSQPQMQAGTHQTVFTTATHLKTQTGQTVIVQNSGHQARHGTPMMIQQGNAGQILLSQGLQGQVQLVASTTQPGQYVLQTSGGQGTYVVAQPQTAVVHGQPQTVLVAQTAQQQGSGTKTIIILQQQPPPQATATAVQAGAGGATQHQKVMVTPQGQQVVVTQVHRPLLQSSTVTNNILSAASVIKATPTGQNAVAAAAAAAASAANVAATASAAASATIVVKKEPPPEDVKTKIVRDLTTPFVCEWGDCNINTKFKSANQVYLHVCETHCPKGPEEIICQWDRCDNMKRKRFSLMTHIHDKHCNTDVMKQSLTRRKQVSQGGKVEPPPPAPTTPHPGYAPDAALHAIKRHALEFVNPKELQKAPAKLGTPVPAPAPRPGPAPSDQDDNEGPVTKSIRLTASLILRNLVIYSSNCRRYLKHYEPHLANVALSNVESSRTIAQVLYDMNEGSSHR